MVLVLLFCALRPCLIPGNARGIARHGRLQPHVQLFYPRKKINTGRARSEPSHRQRDHQTAGSSSDSTGIARYRMSVRSTLMKPGRGLHTTRIPLSSVLIFRDTTRLWVREAKRKEKHHRIHDADENAPRAIGARESLDRSRVVSDHPQQSPVSRTPRPLLAA